MLAYYTREKKSIGNLANNKKVFFLLTIKKCPFYLLGLRYSSSSQKHMKTLPSHKEQPETVDKSRGDPITSTNTESALFLADPEFPSSTQRHKTKGKGTGYDGKKKNQPQPGKFSFPPRSGLSHVRRDIGAKCVCGVICKGDHTKNSGPNSGKAVCYPKSIGSHYSNGLAQKVCFVPKGRRLFSYTYKNKCADTLSTLSNSIIRNQ